MKPKFVALVIALFVVLFGSLIWSSNKAKQGKVTAEVALSSRDAALLCTSDAQTIYHIHPALHIVINGVNEPIPAGIGLTPTCMRSIHTHEADNVLHVESPVEKQFTLGDFFAVWGKDFSKDKIMDTTTTPTTEIVVTVNGTKVDTFENTVLKDLDQIVISYQNK